MAFGRHWEWRGFGVLPPAMRLTLESLPLKFPDAQAIVDEYLWIPGARINVKLRLSCFKLKRCIEERGEFQLWLEDPEENYPFPLHGDVVTAVASELGVALPRLERSEYDRPSFLSLLEDSSPSVRVIAVDKRRWQREWEDPGSPSPPVTIEVAEILAPEVISSVGIEHPTLEGVQHACTALGLAGRLQTATYLEALESWAAGHSVARV